MIKLRLYNTPDRLPYVGKAITAYCGTNIHLIP